MYQSDDEREVIRQIQQMLRNIQIQSGGKVTVPVDGIFGTATTAAVRNFQKENRLPVTGAVDRQTYDGLSRCSREAEFEKSEPLPLPAYANGRTVFRGETGDLVMILQLLLNTLSVGYDDYRPLEVNGVFDERMEQAVRRFQMRNGLPATGEVNKRTWNALVRGYSKYRDYSA